jgi:hypothetical protein
MQHDWVDYMVAFGTVGAAVVSLLAIAVALGIATYDRRRESAREDRERKIQAAQRRLDNALAVLDAWEQCWAIKPDLGLVPGLYVSDADAPEVRSAIGRAIALVSASTEGYEYARRFALEDPKPLTGQFQGDYLQQHPELGEDGLYHQLFGGLHPLAIRNEVQRVIIKAREDLAALIDPSRKKQKPASPASGGTPETLESPTPAPAPEPSPEVLGGPETPKALEDTTAEEKERTGG